MSINKQLYFGIYGIFFLFFPVNLLLVFFSCVKIFFTYNSNIKVYYNEFDTNIVSLNAEIADIFAQLLFHQGNFETYFYRKYYNILRSDMGIKLLETVKAEEEMNKHFAFSFSENNEEVDEKSFFVITNQMTDELKGQMKKLFIFIPTIEISLDTYAFNKENLIIFNKFSFYDQKSNAYISYKYDKNYIDEHYNPQTQLSYILYSMIFYIKYRIPLIEQLNEIKVNELTYKNFFDDNILTLFIPKGKELIIDPFNLKNQQTIHFSSFYFNQPEDHNEKININELSQNNIANYISFDIKLNYLSYLLINFMKINGNYIFILINDLSFSISKSICRLNDYTNFTYSDDSINEYKHLDFDFLEISELQSESISDCFSNLEVENIVQSDIDQNYQLKILYDMFKYSYNNDINSNIKMKILRDISPNKYTTKFLNLKFYYSFSYYFVVFKIYNNINMFANLIDRINYRQVSYIMLFLFILWVVIFIYIFIQLYFITDRISSPIRKLIKNISLSQSNYNIDEIKLEQIYYQEDKDINDLFQLCQSLIIGGFKKKVNKQKKNKLNVYNNISRVKTNNMAINENQIIIQRNQKYNEIFEKGEDKQNINDTFKQDLYYKYKSKDFDNIIKNYESKRLKRLLLDKKEEIEKLKNKNNEYKMFYYTNKELEGFMPYNNLYKFYYERFSKKANKKKKK